MIECFEGLEILDSRGRPTVQATCVLKNGIRASASVPSGASTGIYEAHELRDGDSSRYRGKGCLRAAGHLEGEISRALADREIESQEALDGFLIELDGTPNKERLGANAILAASIAFARAQALDRGIPLFQHFSEMLGQPLERYPRLTINLFSGGLHAGRQVPIQDILIVPASAGSFREGLEISSRVYLAAVDLLAEKYGERWLTADEGGLSPPVKSGEALLENAIEAIERAGLEPGQDVALAMDVASSHFFQEGSYAYEDEVLDAPGMISLLEDFATKYPLVSIEDGLAEEDWDHWPALNQRLEGKALVLGDDLLCTNPKRIQRAINENACNALLLKVNQIGTLTEALEAYRLARKAGWNITISVRSGDTEDDWYSDLVVGWSGDQTKAGSITQSERLSKYNRLLQIEKNLSLPVHSWPHTLTL